MPRTTLTDTTAILCLSHRRFDDERGRPHQLMARAGRVRRVLFVEEPVFEDGTAARLELSPRAGQLTVATPHLPSGLALNALSAKLRELLDELLLGVDDFVAWYDSPLPLRFTRHLRPRAVVYDCLDYLAPQGSASLGQKQLEGELFGRADVVFTSGQSLYEDRRTRHDQVHPFPTSADIPHFTRARLGPPEPADLAALPRPRLGFVGVVDSRFDAALVAAVAAARPAWQLVFVGPVAHPAPPQGPNLHYLGAKPYAELPAYLGHWDLAIQPLARRETTRCAEPLPTPAYLAAGLRVVATPLKDVVRPYADQGLVAVADRPDAFVAAVEQALADRYGHSRWLKRADQHLALAGWDDTLARMWRHVERAAERRAARRLVQAVAPRTRSGPGQPSVFL